MALAPKQIDSFVESTARINIWEGAVRSGKTIASLLRWAEYVPTAPRRGELVVVAKTVQAAYRNVFSPLMDPGIVGAPVARAISYTPGAPTARMFGRQVHVIGANDAKAEPKLRGLTGAGAYGDELTTWPEAFFDQLVARQSITGATIFGTTNPDGPQHWLRVKWLTSGNPSVRSWHFGLDDNPFLDRAYVEHLKRSYSGLWYKRFILGEWCAAEGAIWDSFSEDRHVVAPDAIPAIEQWITVGIDYGTSNPFHAVIIGLGVDRRLYVVSEYRYDSRAQHRQMTDTEYSSALRAWLGTVPIPQTDGRGVRPRYIVVDPSATSFRVQLHRDHITTWPARNDVLDGIRTVSNLLAADRLAISAACEHLIREIYGYAWDPKAQEHGEDKPLKANDHGPDALRYALHTTEAVWRTLVA